MVVRLSAPRFNFQIKPISNELSPRERQVAAFLPACNRDIADALGISIFTVRTHMANIREKLKVTTRQEIQEILEICTAQPVP